MKKILSLFAVLIMAISASAQEKVLFDPEGSYGNGAILSSENTVLELGNDRTTKNYNLKFAVTKAYCSNLLGQKGMVENSETGEMEEKTGVWYVYGDQNPKDSLLTDDTSNGNSYSPASGNLPQSGTYYMITPAKDGHITAFIILNANKNLYVVKGSTGECLPVSALTLKADGSSPTVTALNDDYTVASKVTGTVEFNVFAGETYYVFCTGSKLSFGGYVFVEGIVEPDPDPVDTRERVMFDPEGNYGNGAVLTSEHTQVVLGNDRTTKNYNLKFAVTKAYCSNLLGQKGMVENSETGEMEEKTGVWYVYGDQNPKDSLLTEDSSTGNSYSPESKNLPQSGTYYMITPDSAGHITAFIILNANKSLYVVKGSTGECLPVDALTLKADGSSPAVTALNDDYTVAEKITGTVEFDVEANETYYLFSTGSKLSFGGYLFEERTVIPEPINTREIVKFSADGTYGNGAMETSEHTQVVLGNDRTSANYDLKFAVTKAYCSNLLGQKGMVENSETGVMEEKTGVWYVVGGQNPKDGELNGDTSTGNGYKPGSKNLPQSGTYYMITTTIPGHITAFVIINANKNFYVVKGSTGECLPVDSLTLKADGAEPTVVTLNNEFKLAEKMTGTVEFDVEANETYYVFCTGSKLSFGGYEFVSGNGGVIGDANGDGTVTVTDVSTTVDYMLNNSTEFINLVNADVNGDGDVNITDVTLIVNIILNN